MRARSERVMLKKKCDVEGEKEQRKKKKEIKKHMQIKERSRKEEWASL